MLLYAAFEHEGAAKTLVHHLKYRGVTVYAEVVADALESRVPALPLVPVPRAWSRRIRYGVDPANAIATALGRRIGVPVVPVLRPRLHTRRRAGDDHSRPVPDFSVRELGDPEVVVVDDVVTTGATIVAAACGLGRHRVRMAVAANVVSTVSSLSVQ